MEGIPGKLEKKDLAELQPTLQELLDKEVEASTRLMTDSSVVQLGEDINKLQEEVNDLKR